MKLIKGVPPDTVMLVGMTYYLVNLYDSGGVTIHTWENTDKENALLKLGKVYRSVTDVMSDYTTMNNNT